MQRLLSLAKIRFLFDLPRLDLTAELLSRIGQQSALPAHKPVPGNPRPIYELRSGAEPESESAPVSMAAWPFSQSRPYLYNLLFPGFLIHPGPQADEKPAEAPG